MVMKPVLVQTGCQKELLYGSDSVWIFEKDWRIESLHQIARSVVHSISASQPVQLQRRSTTACRNAIMKFLMRQCIYFGSGHDRAQPIPFIDEYGPAIKTP